MSVQVTQVVEPPPRRFYLEIDHWRAGVWLGTTFQAGEFGITYLPLPPATLALMDWAAGR